MLSIPITIEEYWEGWEKQDYRLCPYCFIKLDRECDITHKDLDDHLYDRHRRMRDDGDVEELILKELEWSQNLKQWNIGDYLQVKEEISHGKWELVSIYYLIIEKKYNYNEFEICYTALDNKGLLKENLISSEMQLWEKLSEEKYV